MSFSAEEIEFITAQPLARLATVGPDGQPDVVPVSFEFEDSGFWIGGSGESFVATKKVRNILNGNRRVALVFDDMVSFEPFIARGIRVYGTALDPIERVGLVGPGTYLRITPTTSWSWNMEGLPVGEAWYPASRREHAPMS